MGVSFCFAHLSVPLCLSYHTVEFYASDGPAPKYSREVSCMSRASGATTLFNDHDMPQNDNIHLDKPATLGLAFLPKVDGYVTAIRFFKATNEILDHQTVGLFKKSTAERLSEGSVGR